MKIYSMTATFGKLEHETLTLQPGLNIIEAPNEWGKSTWCAFLMAMLYGISTRERTTQDSLADKERYAPWSGSPMSGRIDLEWNGRDITIERSTKGRSIFGQFRAYETETGLDVPELTAANCGEMLLGVEKSVFQRAGFLKLTDLPVTQDQALWRRLNALVTTGDESGASDALAQKLKDLKNQCRSNRANGLIPQTLAQKEALEQKLNQLAQLREQSQQIRQRQQSLGEHIEKLENHQAALEYTAARDYAREADAAKLHLEALGAKVQSLEQSCKALPTEQELQQNLRQLQQLRQQQEAVQMDIQMQPAAPAQPEAPAPFRGCTPDQAVCRAKEDAAAYRACAQSQRKPPIWPLIAGSILAVAGLVLMLLQLELPALILFILGAAGLTAGTTVQNLQKQKNRDAQFQAQRLLDRYHPIPPEQWEDAANDFVRVQLAYDDALAGYRQALNALKAQMQEVNTRLSALTGDASWLQREQEWKDALEQHRALADALREYRQAQTLLRSLGADRPLPQPPKVPDDLTFTQPETARLLADAKFEQHQLQLKLGNCQGQMDSLGMEDAMRQQLSVVTERLAKLEQTFAALELAQQTLAAASAELQRRFAPRISQRAQSILGELTHGRYDRLTLDQNLSLQIGAQNEDTLHASLWRSDGTVDQLYLALRLAVAEELTPQAPLILDDALVRFDDARLAAAMDILKEQAQSKQILLFTCQAREKHLLETQ